MTLVLTGLGKVPGGAISDLTGRKVLRQEGMLKHARPAQRNLLIELGN